MSMLRGCFAALLKVLVSVYPVRFGILGSGREPQPTVSKVTSDKARLPSCARVTEGGSLRGSDRCPVEERKGVRGEMGQRPAIILMGPLL